MSRPDTDDLRDAVFAYLHWAAGVCGHCGKRTCPGRATHLKYRRTADRHADCLFQRRMRKNRVSSLTEQIACVSARFLRITPTRVGARPPHEAAHRGPRDGAYARRAGDALEIEKRQAVAHASTVCSTGWRESQFEDEALLYVDRRQPMIIDQIWGELRMEPSRLA